MTGLELQKLSYQRDSRYELCVRYLGEVLQNMGYPIGAGISLKTQASKTDNFQLFLLLELRLDKLQNLNQVRYAGERDMFVCNAWRDKGPILRLDEKAANH